MLIVPTFAESCGKYMLGVMFFLQTNFDFLTSFFDKIFYAIQNILLPWAHN